MQHGNGSTHIASVEVASSVSQAYDFMADAANLSEWSLGAWNRIDSGPGFYIGESLIDGHRSHVQIETDRRNKIIHYHTGPAWDRLDCLIQCRIMPGKKGDAGHRRLSCALNLVVWRAPDMTEFRWRQICATHEAEVYIVKDRIEQRVAVWHLKEA